MVAPLSRGFFLPLPSSRSSRLFLVMRWEVVCWKLCRKVRRRQVRKESHHQQEPLLIHLRMDTSPESGDSPKRLLLLIVQHRQALPRS